MPRSMTPPDPGSQHYGRGTWLEPEELAYVSPTGNHWPSRRRCRAMCEDGRPRIITIGVPDTWFTIPGHDSYNRVGYITIDDDSVDGVDTQVVVFNRATPQPYNPAVNTWRQPVPGTPASPPRD